MKPEEKKEINELFEKVLKFTEFLSYTIAIALAISVSIGTLGVFFYLKESRAIDLFSKVVSNTTILAIIGFFVFILIFFLVFMAIVPALVSSVTNYTQAEDVVSKQQPKIPGSDKSFIGKISCRIEKYITKCNNKYIFCVILFVWMAYQPMLVFFKTDVPLKNLKLCVPLVLFYLLSALPVIVVFLKRKTGILKKYMGLLFFVSVIMASIESPKELQSSILFVGMLIAVIGGVFLKLQAKAKLENVMQESLLLYMPVLAVFYGIFMVLPGISVIPIEYGIPIAVYFISIFVIGFNCVVEHAFVEKLSVVVLFKRALMGAFVFLILAMFFSPGFTKNIMKLTHNGNYYSEYAKENIIIKIDENEYFINSKTDKLDKKILPFFDATSAPK